MPGGLTHLFPSPAVLADAKLTRIGLTSAPAETIRALARAVCDRQIGLREYRNRTISSPGLCEIPGIGQWTTQYVAMRALGEPDAFPSGDLGLLRALASGNSCLLERRPEDWRPWRAYAAMYLWNIASGSKLRGSKLLISKAKNVIVEKPLLAAAWPWWCSRPRPCLLLGTKTTKPALL